MQAIQALQDFSVRYPGSLLTYKALELLGQALLKANQPARLIELASKEPKVRERIGLQLLLARALWQAERLEEAARAFQDVYYNFPTSAEANVAAAALKNLQARLAQNFPSPTVEQHTHHRAGSSGNECVNCHMPKIEQTIADVNVRAHTFRFISPAEGERLKIPNGCAGCHGDKGTKWATEALRGWKEVSPWRM